MLLVQGPHFENHCDDERETVKWEDLSSEERSGLTACSHVSPEFPKALSSAQYTWHQSCLAF